MGPLTTPKKGVEAHCAVDPWTPTSNLKILISAASPDIRNREKRLTLEEAEEESRREDAEEVEEGERMTSRKDKSLGLLCHKFLERFQDYPDPEKDNDISLDDVASELNVERRRIYDIMNVLESLHMVSRSAKNHYTWHGRTKLSQTLFVLRRVGQEQGYHRQMKQIRLRLAQEEERGKTTEDKENSSQEEATESRELFFVELPGVEFKAASVNSRKDKSLRVMSQKFVMLFLVSRPRVVSLDIAAQILIGEDQGETLDKNKFKTKVRRLYDIANVLRSLKLIKKVHVTEERGRKPAFEWVGPEHFTQVKDMEMKEAEKPKVLASRSSKENCAKNLFSNKRFTRHPSLMKLAKSIEEDRRKISSAPSSPAKNSAGDSNMDFPNKMAQLAAICKIQLEHESSGPKSSEPVTPVTPLIPVLLPQQQAGGGAYAVYVPPPPLRARPQPTSLAVRSMTFDSPTGIKRPGEESIEGTEKTEGSPAKAQRRESFRDVSPKLGEILQARLKSHSVPLPSRPAPRALHLDPEFLILANHTREHSSPASASHAAEQSVEAFMEREERSVDSEGLTPLRAVPLTPTTIRTETLVPAGYLIPLSHQSLIGFKDLQNSLRDKPATPTCLFHTPTAVRSRCQEFTPTSVHMSPASVHVTPVSAHVSRASPLCTPRALSPSPAIINFTLQNLGLISGHPQVQVQTQTPTRTPTGTLLSPQPGPVPVSVLSHRGGMVFLKPVCPLQVQSAGNGQQVALISLPQPQPPSTATPKSSASSPGFFHTPVSMTPLAAVNAATASGVSHGNHQPMFIAQRKLDISSDHL